MRTKIHDLRDKVEFMGKDQKDMELSDKTRGTIVKLNQADKRVAQAIDGYSNAVSDFGRVVRDEKIKDMKPVATAEIRAVHGELQQVLGKASELSVDLHLAMLDFNDKHKIGTRCCNGK
ncbi:hypothetical protein [Cohaesibacter gelatinilyticus]|uniref:Methyl-accepting chemotaxis protein n=1 Tax=Cohaesibacter gelatinilyticus TaxID=372072 RepID=A0A285PJ36_9HYPH|nr:hypothetical protein [Cohaesibacter gelatinilyticus]SNZ21740.1 hypothetical protein SAMN06265368_4865 [Cohaesibacter gelatinilyticus]